MCDETKEPSDEEIQRIIESQKDCAKRAVERNAKQDEQLRKENEKRSVENQFDREAKHKSKDI